MSEQEHYKVDRHVNVIGYTVQFTPEQYEDLILALKNEYSRDVMRRMAEGLEECK